MRVDDEVSVDADELVTQALAADPDVEVPDNAVSFDELTGGHEFELLPDWYIPQPGSRAEVVGGWRRRVVLAVVGSILLVDAAGFCVIYGHITIG